MLMRKVRLRLLFFISTIIFSGCASASLLNASTVEYPFTKPNVSVGAKASSLSGCFVAIADDVSAIYWNPAGLSQIKSLEIYTVILNNTYWESTHNQLNFFGLSFPTKYGIIGIGSYSPIDYYTHLTVIATDENGIATGTFECNDEAINRNYTLADSINLFPFWTVGFAMNYINQSRNEMIGTYYNKSQSGAGSSFNIGTIIRLGKIFDIGYNYRAPYTINWVRTVLRDGKIYSYDGYENIPLIQSAAFSLHSPAKKFFLSVDIEQQNWSNYKEIKGQGTDEGNYWLAGERMNALFKDENPVRVGLGFNIFDGFALRAGLATGADFDNMCSLGCSLFLSKCLNLELAYSFTNTFGESKSFVAGIKYD